jgi:sulfite exporter TauE/SafE
MVLAISYKQGRKMQAFLLGISNGAVCIAYCAPVLIPFLFGEGKGVLQNISIVGQFLTGRLFGYLIFAMIAWSVGQTIVMNAPWRDFIIGAADMILAVLLVLYGFFKRGTACTAEQVSSRLQKMKTWRPFMLPATIGLFTGLNFCPPFLLAFTNAACEANLFRTLLFFFLFFLGTTLFFIPFPLIGTLRRMSVLMIIGKMASGVMGLYYFYTGLILVISGIYKT